MISEVSDFIDSSNYMELISRLSANKTETIDGIIPRIEGIQRCYKKDNCAGVEVVAEHFINREFKEAINHKLWKDIGKKVAKIPNVAKKYQKINELIQ